MVTCSITLHGDLPDLAAGRCAIERRLPSPTSARDALEALGLPHGEIGEVRIDGQTKPLDALIDRDCDLAAWPAAPFPLDDPRFICDQHLGKLARLLRFCGFDTLWDRTAGEPVLARLAAVQGRTLLSRHRALLKRSLVTRSLLVRSDHADRQLAEVLRRFQLTGRISRPGRCPTCNGTRGVARCLLALRGLRSALLGGHARDEAAPTGRGGEQTSHRYLSPRACWVPQRGHLIREATRPGGVFRTAPQAQSMRPQPSLA